MATDDLQFDRAESTTSTGAEMACSVCRQPISDAYYTANGATVCGTCRGRLEADLINRPGNFPKAIGLGAGAAVLGAVLYYAVAAITGYEVGLVAIAVGWLVGRALQLASAGRGGRQYQILAVALTYLSVATAYFGLARRTLDGGAPWLTQLQYLFALPIASAIGSLPGGAISLFILFIGLHQAWRMTGSATVDFLGPFQVRRPTELGNRP